MISTLDLDNILLEEQRIKIKDSEQEIEDYVYCKICNEKFKAVNNKHLKKHGITLDEYEKMFPNYPTINNNKRRELINRAKEFMSKKSPEEKSKIAKNMSKSFWDKYNNESEEYKQNYLKKLSNSNKIAKEKIKKEEPNRYIDICKKQSDTRKNLFSNPETSEIMRNNSSKGGINLWNNLSDEDKLNKINLLRKTNQNYWDNLSDEDIKKLINRYSSLKKSYLINNKEYKFRSKFEYNIALYLSISNIDFEYEPDIIIKLEKGTYHKFHIIDFYIPEYNLIIEAHSKGYNKNLSKEETLIDIEEKKIASELNGYNYEVLWYEENNTYNKLKNNLDDIILKYLLKLDE